MWLLCILGGYTCNPKSVAQWQGQGPGYNPQCYTHIQVFQMLHMYEIFLIPHKNLCHVQQISILKIISQSLDSSFIVLY